MFTFIGLYHLVRLEQNILLLPLLTHILYEQLCYCTFKYMLNHLPLLQTNHTHQHNYQVAILSQLLQQTAHFACIVSGYVERLNHYIDPVVSFLFGNHLVQ